ncbi:MAG TPA: M14 family metallopeptidase [Steroidobacteraceae bacterium]|nr:M14 family metallopeptidase [Steroidobacteraceae bacterium]
MMRGLLICGLACLAIEHNAFPAESTMLKTVSEQSGFKKTGRYEEVERLCAAFAEAYPRAVRCEEFGRTPEGRPMLALIASRSEALTPKLARERKLPVVLVQAGIHSGEIEGKDGGFLALRELLDGQAAPGTMKSFVLVFVPVFNIDGHERFGRWNRPNQNGPEEMGWRTTAQNLNLNRDYTKLDAPEMRAMLGLLDAWDPILYVDLHTTDGAQFEPDVSNNIQPRFVGDPGLFPTGSAMLAELNESLAKQGSLPLDFYPALNDDANPAAGFKISPYPPRFSTGYWPLRNRFSLLVETHSWKDYSTRVRIMRNIVVTLADMTKREGANWLAQAHAADERAQALGGQQVTMDVDVGTHATMIDFRGYAYTRSPSSISGGTVVRYDPGKPQIWHVPLQDDLVVKSSTQAPRGGYIVPAAEAAWLSERLTLHGIRFERLATDHPQAEVETFRATRASFSPTPSEGRTTITLDGSWGSEHRDLPVGSLYVPIAQPGSRLILALLEPQSSDSFAAWGFFNVAFEVREYMEAYVADQVAEQMMAQDPTLAAEFKRRLAEDPKFAADPAARLDFFYRHHPSWDDHYRLYPIFRVDAKP